MRPPSNISDSFCLATSYANLKFLNRCEDNAASVGNKRKETTYLHSIATVQLFVYLFVPILDTLTPSDLDNLKLSNGLKIWEPLWSHRQPKVKIFDTPVKYSKQAMKTPTSPSSTSQEASQTLRDRPSIQVSMDAQDRQNSSIYMGRIDEQAEAKVT